jgi:hypothetical protein
MVAIFRISNNFRYFIPPSHYAYAKMNLSMDKRCKTEF